MLLDSGHVWVFKKRNKKGSRLKKNVINCDTKTPEGQSMYSCGKKERTGQGISLIADF